MTGYDRSHMLPRLLCGLLTLSTACFACQADETERVRIALHASTSVSESIVRLQDVADISGGDALSRMWIGSLDLAELSLEQPSESVTATRIAARLAIAGFSPDAYELEGARASMATLRPRLSADALVTEAVHTQLVERFGVPEDEVRVQLMQPTPRWLQDAVKESPDVELQVLLPTNVSLGNVSVMIRAVDGESLTRESRFTLHAELRQRVIVAQHPMTARTLLTREDLAVEERFLAEVAERITVDELVDRVTRRSLAPGAIVSTQKLNPIWPQRSEPLLRPRDYVQLVARVPGLNVMLSNAEVLQAGDVGEMIRVRNTESGRIVVGRIVSAELVEVPL